MDLKEQPLKLQVINFDKVVKTEKREKRHGELLPDTIHAVFCGPSNCGKTNCLLTLITQPNGLIFENTSTRIYMYSKSLNQPKYKFLKNLLNPIEDVQYYAFSEHESVVSPDKASANSIMIFDDMATEKQDNVKAFFCMERYKKVDSFYLCQSYARIPKHLIRGNVNLLVLFRQDDVNIKHIYNDHVNSDMPFEKFKEICSKC